MSEKVSRTTTSGGIGFFGLLTLLFIGLKLTGQIDWSWWLVFAPIWGPWAAVLLIMATMAVCAGIVWLFVWIFDR